MEQAISRLLNDQINKEFYSAYLYLDMASFYQAKGLDGFANWFEVQAKEEQDHALLIYRYLQNNDQAVVLQPIAKPDHASASLADPLRASLEHERYITSRIDALYGAAQCLTAIRSQQS